jgi:hypothetical protein
LVLFRTSELRFIVSIQFLPSLELFELRRRCQKQAIL